VTSIKNPAVNLTTPIGKPIPAGKRIGIIACTIQVCQDFAKASSAAAAILGWTTKTYPNDFTPAGLQTSIQGAIQDKDSGVINVGTDLTPAQLQAFRVAHIPVVGVGNPPNSGYAVMVRDDAYQEYQGRSAAAYIATADKSSPMVGFVGEQSNASIKDGVGVETGLKQYCPACKFESLTLPASALGKDAAERIVSWLRGNSSIKWVVLQNDTLTLGLPGALKAAGLSTKLVSLFATALSVPLLQTGELQAAIGTTNSATGWLAIDGIARTFTGVPVAPDQAANALSVSLSNGAGVKEIPVGPVGYEAAFEKLWNK
jgi:ribose transport system substrate-binding protein